MPVSPLCCHAVPPVSRQSFHRYSSYMETDTSRCGTLWVYTTRTCVIDAKTLLPGCRVNVAEVCTVQTPTPSWEAVRLKGCFTGESSTSPCAAETTTTTMMMMMIGFSRPPKDELIVGSTSMVVEVPRGCKRDEKHLLQLNTGMTKPTISLVTSMAWIA